MTDSNDSRSVVARLAEALAQVRPDLISELVTLDRNARERAEKAFFSRLSRHDEELRRLEAKLEERVDAQIRSATLVRHLTDDLRTFREEVVRTARDVIDDVRATQTQLREHVAAADRDLADRYAALMEAAGRERDTLLEEQRRRYEAMFAGWREERDQSLRERDAANASLLAESRTSFELREEAQRADFEATVAELREQRAGLERLLEQQQTHAAESSRAQAAAFEALRAETSELIRAAHRDASDARAQARDADTRRAAAEDALAEALASRDRLVERVARVEESLERVVHQYRDELDVRRARIEELERELRESRNEVEWYRNEIGAAGLLPRKLRA